MQRHLKISSYFQELGQLISLLCDNEIVDIDLKKHLINAVLNCCIIDQNNNWSQLNLGYYIKTLKPEIDGGLKAFKELDLFKKYLL